LTEALAYQEMDVLRKEHAKELERFKSEQESEQKNYITLLQRQNYSLECKCEKLQTHIKLLEAKAKELVNTIDLKNKTISDKEELRNKMEADYKVAIF
jgi:septal ring factor EnvC (AmiA/AmiB activator)